MVVSSIGDTLESDSLKSSPEKGKESWRHLATVCFVGVELGKCVVTLSNIISGVALTLPAL